MTLLFRSLLFVPGNNSRFLEKARSLVADIVCLDLEDSVPDGQKADARRMIASALESAGQFASPVFVRTNSPASGQIPDDLAGVVQEGLAGVVIPKVDGAADLREAEGVLSRLEGERGLGPVSIIPSVESARGVVNCHEIASFGSRVPAVVFGVFDLLNDLGAEYSKGSPGAMYSRQKVPVDARAAGVAAIDSIWQDLGDPAGLEEDCRLGKSLGYAGKSIIHPDQIAVAHRLFRPSKAEILWAQQVCEAYLGSVAEGRGATSVEGKMIDEVHFKQARALLDLVE